MGGTMRGMAVGMGQQHMGMAGMAGMMGIMGPGAMGRYMGGYMGGMGGGMMGGMGGVGGAAVRAAARGQYLTPTRYLTEMSLHPDGHTMAIITRGQCFEMELWDAPALPRMPVNMPGENADDDM